jgi:hypothetical protein
VGSTECLLTFTNYERSNTMTITEGIPRGAARRSDQVGGVTFTAEQVDQLWQCVAIVRDLSAQVDALAERLDAIVERVTLADD